MILLLDAATSTVVAGLAQDGRILTERRLAQGRGDVIPDLVQGLLDELDRTPADVESVVCGVGPGSFTGIRIALSFAQGFAFRRNLPCIGVSSLLAASGEDVPGRTRVVLLDALRGEAYARRIAADGTTGPDRRLELSGLGPLFSDDPVVIAEGRTDFVPVLPQGWFPLAGSVGAAGLLAAARREPVEAVPNYLRASAPEEIRAAKG